MRKATKSINRPRPESARPYRMARRAEHVDGTRQRIVEATVRLHQRIGLRTTTISAVAEEAGVTRATVYRHFPDGDGLFEACSSHWLANQVLPDPASWMASTSVESRIRVGLRDVYRFYRTGARMLTHVESDFDVLPASVQRRSESRDAALVGVLGEPMGEVARDPLVAAALRHAVSFATWRSLCVEQSLDNDQAVEAMAALVLGLWRFAVTEADVRV